MHKLRAHSPGSSGTILRSGALGVFFLFVWLVFVCFYFVLLLLAAINLYTTVI